MKTLDQNTITLIQNELESIPEKYQKNFNSTHEGYAVILEEVRELETEVFFGEKPLREQITESDQETKSAAVKRAHQQRMKEECVQIAAMCVRFIQELTTPQR
jgi:hypothetical protein